MGQILTINTGSSSIKASLYQEKKLLPSAKIVLSGIGADDGKFSVKSHVDTVMCEEKTIFNTHKDAFIALIQWLRENSFEENIQAVGHRIVHGGAKYREPTQITPEVFKDLETIIPYDPLHIPSELEGIALIQALLPHIPHIASFDTAFHQTLPEVSRIFPIPYSYTAEGLFRYGFHGLSFESIVETLKGEQQLPEKLIIAHLGSGCSLAAVKEGKSIDTTMGFTSTGGLVMGTRSGDLDPGLLTYLLLEKKIEPKQLSHMLNFESGLKGISQQTSEMVELLEANSPQANLAVAIFCYHIKKSIGAFIAVLGGVDLLVFTGGIGENSEFIRNKICENLACLGIQTSTNVRVIQANEEKMLAKHTQEVLTQEVNLRR